MQIIWDEIGEGYSERDKMLLELEQECLDIYNKKVDKTRKHRAELQRSLAQSEAEIATLMSALGEQVSFSKKDGSLKEQISSVKPLLEELMVKKDLRWREVSEIVTQIAEISSNIAGNDSPLSSVLEVDGSDLTKRKLDELRAHLQDLRNEKVCFYTYKEFYDLCVFIIFFYFRFSGCSAEESELLYQCCPRVVGDSFIRFF